MKSKQLELLYAKSKMLLKERQIVDDEIQKLEALENDPPPKIKQEAEQIFDQLKHQNPIWVDDTIEKYDGLETKICVSFCYNEKTRSFAVADIAEIQLVNILHRSMLEQDLEDRIEDLLWDYYTVPKLRQIPAIKDHAQKITKLVQRLYKTLEQYPGFFDSFIEEIIYV